MEGWGRSHWGVGRGRRTSAKPVCQLPPLQTEPLGGGGVPLRAVPFSIWRMAVSAKPGSRSPRMLHWVSRDVESEKSLKAALVG